VWWVDLNGKFIWQMGEHVELEVPEIVCEILKWIEAIQDRLL
jgi:hypothetical protein